MKEILTSLKAYQWQTKNGISFRGYIQFLKNSKVYRSYCAIELLKGVTTQDELIELLREVDGCYSIIINRGDYTLAAVDRARSLPLFLSSNYISDSAEEIRKAEKIAKEAVDKDLFLEFSTNHFLFGHDTVYKEIKQLDLGETVFIKNKDVAFRKYYYHVGKIKERPVGEIKKELTETAVHAFKRLKEVIAGRPVVLSLSGGYDSRFIACMLKMIGIEDVSCYTYGKKDNHEVVQSKKVAEALGYRWICVEMTDELMSKQLDEVGMSYIDSYTGHDYSCYFQNFPAVRKLHEENWFKPGSVFITGLCGDMPTGAYIKKEEECIYDSSYAASTLYDMLFNSFIMEDTFKEKRLLKMKNEIEDIPVKIEDYNSWQTVVDCIYTGTCHAHAYLHMNSAHSFFGYEWLLPYWSAELLNVWYSISPDLKRAQALYEDWLLNDICSSYGIGQKKKIVVYTDNPWKRKFLYYVGGIISFILLNTGHPITRKTDYNNFSILELELFRKLKVHKHIKYKKCGIMHMLGYFTTERRYGISNFLYFSKNCRVRIN